MLPAPDECQNDRKRGSRIDRFAVDGGCLPHRSAGRRGWSGRQSHAHSYSVGPSVPNYGDLDGMDELEHARIGLLVGHSGDWRVHSRYNLDPSESRRTLWLAGIGAGADRPRPLADPLNPSIVSMNPASPANEYVIIKNMR